VLKVFASLKLMLDLSNVSSPLLEILLIIIEGLALSSLFESLDYPREG
jgi:hypothetical protein